MPIPPPLPAEFDENEQLVRVGEEGSEEELYIPPPYEDAEFDMNVQLVRVGEEEELYIPPP